MQSCFLRFDLFYDSDSEEESEDEAAMAFKPKPPAVRSSQGFFRFAS
jgi:hypothetical protein